MTTYPLVIDLSVRYAGVVLILAALAAAVVLHVRSDGDIAPGVGWLCWLVGALGAFALVLGP